MSVVGTGSVRSADGAIDCPGDCEAGVDVGDILFLEALPDLSAGTAFSRWDSGLCAAIGEDATCEITIARDETLVARFGFPLLVATTGDGAGLVITSGSDPQISCGGTCSGVFDAGAQVELFAAEEATSVFQGWLNTCSSSNPCVVTMDQPQTVTAKFFGHGRPLSAATWGAAGGDALLWSLDRDPASNDLILCGSFENTVTFGGTAVTAQDEDGFLMRRDEVTGATVWFRVFRDPNNAETDRVHVCRVDDQDGVVVGGIRWSNNEYDFDGDATSDLPANQPTGGTNIDGFVGRFALADGTFDWLSGSGSQNTGANDDVLWAVAVGEGTIWAGGNIGNGSNDAFHQRYNPNSGTPQNAASNTAFGGGGAQGTEIYSMMRDPNDNHAVFAGYYDTQVTFSDILFSGGGSRDVLIGRINDGTTPQWAVGFGGNQDDQAFSVAVDPVTRRIAVTGHIDEALFVAVLDNEGNTHFFRQYSGSNGNDGDRGWTIAWTTDGGLLVGGYFSTGADFGTGPLTSIDDVDAFVLRLDAGFDTQWVRTFGGLGPDEIRSILVADGGVWAGGAISGAVDFGGDVGTVTPGGDQDAILLKLLP